MHEELIGPRIGAHDVGRTQTHIAPCGQPVRRQGGQRLPDELGDIRRAFIVPAGRGRLGGAEHRVVGNHDAQRAEPALVAWSLRICNRFEDRLGSRHQGASRAVDRAGDRGAGTGEVDRHLVPGHRDADVDRDLRPADPIAVDVVVGRVDAIGDLGDRLPARALAMVEDVGKGMPQRADAITGADFLQACVGDADRRDFGVEVPQRHLGQAHVGGDDVDDLVYQLTASEQAQLGELHAFLEDFRRVRRQATGYLAADFAPVRDRNGEGDQLIPDKHRLDQGDVGGVRPAGVRVIRHVDVAWGDAARVLPQNALHLHGEGSGEQRDAVRLRDELGVRVGDPAGEVQHFVDHGAHAGAGEDDPHLVRGGEEFPFDDLDRDGIHENSDRLARVAVTFVADFGCPAQ